MHRNTPCPVSCLSPSQVLFGHVLRDSLPLQPGKFKPRYEWRLAADKRAEIYSKRKFDMQERLTRGTRPLQPLSIGDHVLIQNQNGNNPRQWSQTGVIVEIGSHDSYLVSIGGSRKLTRRNRQFLRKISPPDHAADKVGVTSTQTPGVMQHSLPVPSTTPPSRVPIQAPVPATHPTSTTSDHGTPAPRSVLPVQDLISPVLPVRDPVVPVSMDPGNPVSPSDASYGVQVPPIKLRRSGPEDTWMVAGQQSFPCDVSCCWNYSQPWCYGHMVPCQSSFAPSSSCPTLLPRFR